MRTLEQASTISERDKTLLRQIKQIVQSFDPTAEVLLYGSVARGTQTPESDYDLLILTDAPLGQEVERRRLRWELHDLELEQDIILSTIWRAKEEWERHVAMPFHGEVERDGVSL